MSLLQGEVSRHDINTEGGCRVPQYVDHREGQMLTGAILEMHDPCFPLGLVRGLLRKRNVRRAHYLNMVS
jgi:hypothetical protein